MTIFVVTGQQAGSGKTTIAMHLSEGLRKSAKTALFHVTNKSHDFEWVKQANSNFSFEHLDVSDDHIEMLEVRLKQLMNDHEHLVVDISGHDHAALRTVLKYADKILVPTTGIQQDLNHVAEMMALAIALKPFHPELQLYILFNKVPSETTQAALAHSQQLLQDIPNAHFLKTVIYHDQDIEQLMQTEVNVWKILALKNKMIDAFVKEILQP